MGMTQEDAGVLESKGKGKYGGKRPLTKAATAKFIKDVKQHLLFGTAGAPPLPVPCGPEVPAVPFADQIELEDESKYPEWHKNVLGLYERIANTLNVQGQFTILPICCPISLSLKLDFGLPNVKFPPIPVGLALPLLAAKLDIKPPKLALKFPGLMSLPPAFELPSLPEPPELPEFPDLFDFAFPYPKLPELVVDLMIKMPNIFLDLLQFDLSAICKVVLDSKLFGDFPPNEAIVWLVSNKILVAKTTECVAHTVVGVTVGSARPPGVVGSLGKKHGYFPPAFDEPEPNNIRDKIVKVAKSGVGLSWGKDKKIFQKHGANSNNFDEIELPYTEFLFATDIHPIPKPGKPLIPYRNDKNARIKRKGAAYSKGSKASSCGLFIRACYMQAGGTDPDENGKYEKFYTDPYVPSVAIGRLIAIAKKRGANIPFSKNNIPALKKGDAVLVRTEGIKNSEHVGMITKDYPGGEGTVEAINGGQGDVDNPGYSTAIKQGSVTFSVRDGKVYAGADKTGRLLVALFDGEKMVSTS